MSRYNENEQLSTMEMLKFAARMTGLVLGIITIILGLISAMKTFGLIFSAFTDPQAFSDIFENWVFVVGGDRLDINLMGKPYPIARIFTIFVLGGGALILTILSLGIMLVGAKIVSWTSSEREAIKQILTHVFGMENPEK